MADDRKDLGYGQVSTSLPRQEAQATSVPAQELVCRCCGHGNVDFAKFCAECGKSLLSAATCPGCNAATLPGADICESCGAWLLIGQCMFCAAPVEQDQAYCGICGNPTTGIPCPGCGEPSKFDFCKRCSIPLSPQAHEMARALASDPAQQQLTALLQEMHAAESDVQAIAEVSATQEGPDEQVVKMKLARAAQTVREAPGLQRATSRSLFSAEQRKQISLLDRQVVQEQERRRHEEERRKLEEERIRQEAERQRLEKQARLAVLQEKVNLELRKLQGKRFSSSQEARRFFMSLLSGLPGEIARSMTTGALGWRCNAYDCTHDSPADCADPSRGGVWLIR